MLYNSCGITHCVPTMILFSKGNATDIEKEEEAKKRLKELIEHRNIMYYSFTIGNADVNKLMEYYPDATSPKEVPQAEATNIDKIDFPLWEEYSCYTDENSRLEDWGTMQPFHSNIVVGI